MEQNFYEPEGHFDSDADVSIKKWKSISTLTTDSENDDGGFDCNICLDSAHEPVVTLCGHLYCWPCIYKWLQVPTTSDKSSHMKGTCPVCKANITHALLVPLYGRGTSHSDSEGKKPQLGQIVPRRPSPELNTLMTNILAGSLPRRQLDPNYLERHSQPVHDQYYPSQGGYAANSESSDLGPSHGGYAANSESSYLGAATMTTLSHPTIGMVGEFVFARMFGSSDTSIFSYPYMNSYPPSSPRMRRQEVQLDKSLNRYIWVLGLSVPKRKGNTKLKRSWA